jgi:hypothetical protein
MKYLHSDLGFRERGDVLVVTLSSGANVRLLDSSNFSSYKRGQRHRFHGGLAKRSPVRLTIPSNGHWHAVVDMQGLRGSTRASFKVLNGSALRPLPPIEERRSDLAEIADNIAEVDHTANAEQYDVFISHASEDKETIVVPLANALEELGVRVWFDQFALRIGDSLRRKIDEGIANSRFGVVVLSKSFLAKGWPQYELDGLVTMAVSGKQILLPIWHEISKDEVVKASPSLADKVALRTADYGVREIAAEIAAVVSSHLDGSATE